MESGTTGPQTTSHRVIRSVADLTDQELGALLASEEAAEADQQARH
jgi:hypothetical protein